MKNVSASVCEAAICDLSAEIVSLSASIGALQVEVAMKRFITGMFLAEMVYTAQEIADGLTPANGFTLAATARRSSRLRP